MSKYLDFTGLSYLTNKIKTLINAKADKSHTHNYAGSSSAGGSATSANKLATAKKIGLSGGATGTATAFDGSADITIPVTSVSPSHIADGYTTKGFYINTHPENSPTILPFINNDIAYLLKRGGSAKVTYDGVVQNIDISNVFDGSPSYWAINPTGVTEIVIELTLHKTFTWTNTVYVDMGANGWRAKSVKLEVINTSYTNDVWTTKKEETNRTLSQFKHTFSHKPVGAENEGGGFNKIRLTFNSWYSANIFRIAAIGIINYSSSGLRETFLPKDGGSIYGAITPYSNNSIDFGSSSMKWKNVYATTFNGSLNGIASKATTLDGLTSTISELNYVDGVTSNIQTQLNGKASSSHGNHVPETQTANNAKFLRNDNTWQTVTPANIGAATNSHTHNYAGSSSAGGAATSALTCTGNSATATNADMVDGCHAYQMQTLDSVGGNHGSSWLAQIQHNRDNDGYFKLYCGDGSIGTKVDKADISSTTNALNSTGFGYYNFTFYQGEGEFDGRSGWAHYLISNHGNGGTEYHYTIALPYWDTPIYKRQWDSGNNSGWQKFYTTENITYGTWELTPGSSALATGNIYLQYE